MVLQTQGVFDAFLCVVDLGIIGISLCVVMYLGLPQYGSTALCDGMTPMESCLNSSNCVPFFTDFLT